MHSERTTAPDSPQERDVIRRFAEAFSNDDIEGVIELLTHDAWLAMPPAPHEYHGPAAIGAFLRASATWRGHRRFRLVLTRANTQPAFGCYLTDGDTPTARPIGLLALTRRFGLPETLTDDPQAIAPCTP